MRRHPVLNIICIHSNWGQCGVSPCYRTGERRENCGTVKLRATILILSVLQGLVPYATYVPNSAFVH